MRQKKKKKCWLPAFPPVPTMFVPKDELYNLEPRKLLAVNAIHSDNSVLCRMVMNERNKPYYLFCQDCRARSACTYLPSDLALHSPWFNRLFLSTKSHQIILIPSEFV